MGQGAYSFQADMGMIAVYHTRVHFWALHLGKFFYEFSLARMWACIRSLVLTGVCSCDEPLTGGPGKEHHYLHWHSATKAYRERIANWPLPFYHIAP